MFLWKMLYDFPIYSGKKKNGFNMVGQGSGYGFLVAFSFIAYESTDIKNTIELYTFFHDFSENFDVNEEIFGCCPL